MATFNSARLARLQSRLALRSKATSNDLVSVFKSRLERLRQDTHLLESTEKDVQLNDEILEKLEALTKLVRQIDKLSSELEELQTKYSDIINAPEIKQFIEQLEDKYYKFSTVYGEYILKLQKGYTRTTYAYADVVKTLLKTLPDKHVKLIEKLLEESKKVSEIADRIVLEKPKNIRSEEQYVQFLQEDNFFSRLWNKLVDYYERFVNFFSSFLDIFSDDIDELTEYMEKDMAAMEASE